SLSGAVLHRRSSVWRGRATLGRRPGAGRAYQPYRWQDRLEGLMTAEDRDDSGDEVGNAGALSAAQGSPADAADAAASPRSSAAKVDAQTLELRAAPAAVTRLNRRTLMVLIGGVALLVMMAAIWSLQPRE